MSEAASPTRITFEPDLVSLAIADNLVREQGVTLEEIAAEAFLYYTRGARDAAALDLDENASDGLNDTPSG